MSSPKITVLMTVYNGEQYLKQTVSSILKQTYLDFEFLIIDDTSTDSSMDILNFFQDSRIRIVCNEQNMGQTRSLNKGLQLAKGKYIARMDADDLAYPHWLENQITFIENNPEYVVVSANAVIINSKGDTVKILNSPQPFEEVVLKSLIACQINHVGSLYQKNIILEHGGYDESFTIAEDYDLWSKLIRAGKKLTRTSAVSIAIRFHDQSTSIIEKGNKTDLIEISRIMRDNIRYLTGKEISEGQGHLLWHLIYKIDALNLSEFRKANRLWKNIYDSIDDSFGISKQLAKKFRKKITKIVYIKKIFSVFPCLERLYACVAKQKAKRILT